MLALMSCKNGNTCQNKTESDMISYHKIQIEDCNVFYREAGSSAHPQGSQRYC